MSKKSQKIILRYCGIGLLVCGILLSAVFGQIKEANQPNKVTFGYYITGSDGNTVGGKIDDGYIGGNAKNVEEAGVMSTMYIMVAIAGGIMAAGSFYIQDEKTQSKESENQ